MVSFIKKYISIKQPGNSDKSVVDIDAEIIKTVQSIVPGEINTVFDIGAYQGRYAKTVNNQIKNANIYCFEPFPESFDKLKIQLNGECYHLYQMAMSDKKETNVLYVNRLDETNSLLPSSFTNSVIDSLIVNERIINVDVDTVQNFCAELNIKHIDLLKIDAQGNTLNVLKGATDMLIAKKISAIQCEVEFIEIYKNQFLYHHVTSFLEDFGYKLYSLYQLHYDINNRLSWADALYYTE